MATDLEPTSIKVDDALLRRAYESMVHARRLDIAAIAWQRQGILPAYPPLRGQEAAQVGSALAADLDRDFLFATYRDHAAAMVVGVDPFDYYAAHLNLWHGGLWDPMVKRFAPLQAVVAGSVLHAVGWALGSRLAATGGVALAYLGDGASSEGDTHEAMNFAAVLRAPVVFFVQNNRWALSVPLHKQVAGGSVAARAAGYGIEALQIDGDDVLACYQGVKAAVERARSIGRPVVVEAMTYRRGPHATSDDPSRYRTLEEERAAGPDPLLRAAELLRSRGLLDDAEQFAIEHRVDGEIETLRRRLLDPVTVSGDDMFRYVFQEPTPQLGGQQAAWRADLDLVGERTNA